MSPDIYSCILCGFPIYDHGALDSESWVGEFRAIYSSSLGAFVSGVGCRDIYGGAAWIAPLDPTMRWDDDDNILLVPEELPVMRQHPENGYHGFVLHDACWGLLQRACHPGEIPFERLLEVCESLPFPLRGYGVCWGHDYGGLLALDDRDHFPWEDRLVEQDHNVQAYSYAKENPYNVSDIPTLLAIHLEHPSGWLPQVQGANCFSQLPWEILEAIAIELPTCDALGLRLVSSAFLPLLSSGNFWASRFKASGDRGFMFEKWNSRGPTDWLSLYRLTSYACKSPGLQNRMRIWELIRPLTELISMRLAEGSKTAYMDPKFANLRWSKVAGYIKVETIDMYPIDFSEGCRLFGTHIAHIPKDLVKIGFTLSRVGNVSYIAGIRLMAEKNPDICLGFISRSKEIICEVKALKGFVLAANSRGIHALQVASEGASLSKWVGCPNNVPRTERLAHFNSISALEVGFDGYKIVSLGVSETISPATQVPKAQGLSLREAALWYPTVPETKLCLNEVSFTGEKVSSTRYQPIFWIHFGGPGGSYLKHVTGVSVDYLLNLYSLEFQYDTALDSTGANKLGRCKVTGTSGILEFSIDGAGGELIEAIEVTLKRYKEKNAYNFLRHGKLNSIKFTTNRKRSFHVGALSDNANLEPLSITPGTTLTGLYASQHREAGLISLGAISETID